MSDKGWIKLHRRIQDHWIYQEKRQFSRYEAWIDLLMMANHKDNKSLIDGELLTIKKGQLITSIRKLCNKWDWSNTKVKNFLELLQEDEMITYKSDTKKTVINICNYSVYHDTENEENDTETTRKHNRNISETHQKHTNKNVKNVKNDKNEKNNKYIRLLYEHYLSKGIIEHQRLTDQMKRNARARLRDYSFEDLKKAIDNYAKVLHSDNHWFTHKYPFADLMREKDITRFLDEADPLNNFLKRQAPGRQIEVVPEWFDNQEKAPKPDEVDMNQEELMARLQRHASGDNNG